MNKDLEKALETVAHLRAMLQLAYFDKQELTAKDVKKALADARKVLKKNGMDDLAHEYESK